MAFYGIVAGMGRKTAMIKVIKKKLIEKGAVSPKTAVTPEEAGITSKRDVEWINRFINEGKIGQTKHGKIWWKE